MGAGVKELSGVSHKGLVPIMRAPPSGPNHLPKAPPPSTLPLELGSEHRSVGPHPFRPQHKVAREGSCEVCRTRFSGKQGFGSAGLSNPTQAARIHTERKRAGSPDERVRKWPSSGASCCPSVLLSCVTHRVQVPSLQVLSTTPQEMIEKDQDQDSDWRRGSSLN